MTAAFSPALLRAAFLQTRTVGPAGARLVVHLGLALLFMLTTIWLNSGTLSPLSATPTPRMLLDCGYTGNTDHAESLKLFWMLKGYPVSEWGDSIYLRRLLYPLLAFPFFSLFGFVIGGFVANCLIHAVTLIGLGWFLFVTLGRRGAVAGVWLFATWPGVFYWAALPYAHATIVPITVWGFMLLHVLSQRRGALMVGAACFGLGVLCQAYDLLVYFGPAALGLMAWCNRRPGALVLGLAGLVLPSLITAAVVLHVFHAPTLFNDNTGVYGVILGSYIDILRGTVDWRGWFGLILEAPSVLVQVFFDSGFSVLPALGLLLALLNIRLRLVRFHPAELAFGAALLAVFLFNNLAPPYQGWQMRGDWIARLYSPLFIVFLFFTARMIAEARSRGLGVRLVVAVPLLAAVALNAALSLGGFLAKWDMTSLVIYRFYHTVDARMYIRHLDTYGRRPLGFCVRDGHWPSPYRGGD